MDKADYNRFILSLYLINNKGVLHVQKDKDLGFSGQGGALTAVDIGAYCLMPNHFHLLIKCKNEKGITNFMHRLTTAYTMYFNKRYERVGPLFQGTFKAEHANSDEYLKYLFSYIHLNPIKLIDPLWKENGIGDVEKAQSFLDEYTYSSYLDYSSDFNRKVSVLLDKGAFPEYFSSKEEFLSNINEWLSFDKTE